MLRNDWFANFSRRSAVGRAMYAFCASVRSGTTAPSAGSTVLISAAFAHAPSIAPAAIATMILMFICFLLLSCFFFN